jgi:hypothetical protein
MLMQCAGVKDCAHTLFFENLESSKFWQSMQHTIQKLNGRAKQCVDSYSESGYIQTMPYPRGPGHRWRNCVDASLVL